MTVELIQTEIELEEESLSMGVKRYRDNVQKATEGNRETDLMPQNSMIHRVLPKMINAIEDFKEEKGKLRRKPIALKYIQMLSTEKIAFITSKVILNGISKQQRLQDIAIAISNKIHDELEYAKFKEHSPGLYHHMGKKTEKTTSYRHYRVLFMRAKNWVGCEDDEWPLRDKTILGTTLIDLFKSSTGLIDVVTVAHSVKRNKTIVRGTAALLEWLDSQHSRCELMAPIHMPMIIPPMEWSSPTNGGYLTPAMKIDLLKVRNQNYLEELSYREEDMADTYRAVNALQNTAWRINKGVLRVMEEVWDSGGSLGGLPKRDLIPLPAKPEDIATNAESRKQWKIAASKIHEQNARTESKRLAISQKLWLATKFSEFEKIYFPWSLDWRGRAYPVPGYVNPQGDDSGKALLQFAEGKPLGENGAYWLAVHTANVFGEDKLPFDERVQWVEDNMDKILDSAVDPLGGERFWTTADKPYNALAACFEWLGYSLQGEDFVSHLPIAMDGSCNGLQNFSAMLRDDVGGRAVNLIPADKPNDIYMDVARVAEEQVNVDAEGGNALAKLWVGNISRNIVKRPVMTLPYGSTKAGMKGQILEELRKMADKGVVLFDPEMDYQAALYLADVVYNSIGKVVVAARQAMDWLQESAKIAAKDGMPIRWTTPLGLPVMQMYRKMKTTKVNSFISGNRIQLNVSSETQALDKRKMGQGISPNVVHSLDAAHMMRTVLLCLDESTIASFAMVHDSFGTHAADADEMYYLLRKAFVQQYSGNYLEDFRNELLEQLPEELADQIPPIPAIGNLDLDLITESQYFFA